MEGEGASTRYAHDTLMIRYQMHTSHVYFYSIYFGTMHTFVSFISKQDAYIPSSIEGADDNDFPIPPHKHNQEEEQDFSIAPNLSAAEFVDHSLAIK